MRTVVAGLGLALGLSAAGADAATVIHAGRMIDAVSDRVTSEVTLVVEGDRIVAVEPGYRVPAGGDRLIDLREATVMPGLMDMHVHLTSEYTRSYELQRYTMSEADRALEAVANGRTTLMAGFTTVRDLADIGQPVMAPVRDAINAGKLPGPRIYAATLGIASTGGHLDRTSGWAPWVASADPRLYDSTCNGADACREAVRQRYKLGADVIKVTATGGVLSIARSGDAPQFTVEELAAIVETARDYGYTVAAHAHGNEGARRAVLAGVASIEHGTYLDADTMELMRQKGTYLVPTISAGWWVKERSDDAGFFPEVVRPKAAAIGALIQQTFARAYKAGVPIMFGTDCGVCEHGSNAREFAYMVEAGMPALAAIKSATIVPARFLGIEDRLGSLEAGKVADIVAVPGNPLEDITAMQRVVFVMKDGVIHRQEAR